MVEKLLLVILGVVLSSIAYLVKRRMEKRSVTEALDIQQRVLSINKSMRDQGLSLEDMQQLAGALSGRSQAIAERTASIQGETKSLVEQEDGEFISQAEMSMRADANLRIAQAQLHSVYTEISFKVGEEERTELEASQEAWEVYAVKQAEAESASYKRGSIYPMIYAAELESLTAERAARLSARLEQLKAHRA